MVWETYMVLSEDETSVTAQLDHVLNLSSDQSQAGEIEVYKFQIN